MISIVFAQLCFAQNLDTTTAKEQAQTKYTLSGTIAEKATGETLFSVNVLIPELGTGTVTNQYGFYSITLPEGTYLVQYSTLGYQTVTDTIRLYQDLKKDITMVESSEDLDAVVIETDIEATDIKSPEMSTNALKIETIKKVPVLLGETDIIKALTLLPGITRAGEGAAGFNVRGGAADQNLVLLDEATLFTSDHLFGFFSVFNPDAIKDLKLYKGGIPAEYGGRVSSVLDIYQRDGNSQQFSTQGGIGLVSSRLLLEGPLFDEKFTYLIGGRSSYAHLFLPLFDIDNIAYFYDLNAKLTYRASDKHKFFMSSYFGRDVFNITDFFENDFGNAFVNFRWNHLYNDKLFGNLSLIYSDYNYRLVLDFVQFEFNSGIDNFNLKYDLSHYVKDGLTLDYGINSIYHSFNPGLIEPVGDEPFINRQQLTRKYAVENAAYASVKHNVTDKLTIQAGLRFSSFHRLGQDSLNVYDEQGPIVYEDSQGIYRSRDPIETVSFDRSDVLENFYNLEPRLSLSYLLNDNSSVKASYQRLAQYLHQISNTNSPTPFDLYAPSGPFIEPQIGQQVAGGYFRKFGDFSLETEVYYKWVSNRLDYIDGADLIANDAVEQILLNGRSRAYGLEVLFKKDVGKLTGWIAYTLSRAEQQTTGGSIGGPGINNGDWYTAGWDKTHDLTTTANYELNKKWSFSGNFTLQTGIPVTFPDGRYNFGPLFVPTFEERNASRLPTIHRLDLAATYVPKPDKKKGWQGSWVFSIYNVYNRRNAVSVSFGENEDTGANEATRLALFGIVPAVTYNFKF
jgi:hypothetical protein